MNRKILCAAACIVCVVVFGTAALAADMSVGTWKVNLAKSKFDPAGLAPKSQSCKNEPAGTGVKVTCDVVDSQGKSVHYEFTGNYDGKDVAVKGDPNRDMTALKKTDDYTYEATNMKGSKVTTKTHTVYARDGKSRTITVTGTNPQGQKVTNTIFWDKQ